MVCLCVSHTVRYVSALCRLAFTSTWAAAAAAIAAAADCVSRLPPYSHDIAKQRLSAFTAASMPLFHAARARTELTPQWLRDPL